MKLLFTMLAAAISLTPALSKSNKSAVHGYPINPVPFTSVKVTPGTFWGQRLEASRNVTIPLAFSKCEETGRYTNFSNAASHLADASKVFDIKKGTFPFDDTDPYKTIEGASYILQTYPDKKLAAYIDSVLDVIASAQEPDGYLYTARTQNPEHPHDWSGPRRWSGEEQEVTSCTISVTWSSRPLPIIRLRAAASSSTSPFALPTSFAKKLVLIPGRRVSFPVIRLPKWLWQNSIS